MFAGIRVRGFVVLAGLVGALSAVQVGADGGAGVPSQPILIPDRADSSVMIDADGWDQPIEVRVVTLADQPVLSIPAAGDQPSEPQRVATTILHPVTGEPVEINVVEIGRRAVLLEDGTREVRWVVNDELPFTRESEVRYAAQGLSAHQRREGSRSDADEVVGWISGAPVVEVYVWFDASQARTARPNYGIQIVSHNRLARKGDAPGSAGGDPGGSPGPPSAQGGESGCGGDPGGSSDPPCGGNGRRDRR